MAKLADVVAQASAPRAVVELCVDGGALLALSEARADFDRLRRQHGDSLGGVGLAEAEGRVAEALQVAQEASVPFTLEAMGELVWRKLLGEHPPTAADKAQGLDHDAVEFRIAALARCLVDPEGDADDVRQLAEVLPPGAWQRLWATCVALHRQDGVVGESDAVSVTRRR